MGKIQRFSSRALTSPTRWLIGRKPTISRNLTQSSSFRPMKAASLFAVGLLLVAASAEARTEERTFQVRDGGQLTVDTDRGSIKVTTHNRDEVRVDVQISGSKADRFEVDFSQQGNEVTVNGDYDGNSSWNWGWGGNSLKVEYRITVPQEFDVDLKTSGGSIRVEDLEGEVFAKTSGGSLHFGDIQGNVKGKTSGGSITLEGSRGDADVHTSGGSIRLGDVDGRVLANTSGGSITIDQARGDVEASTSGGSIRVDEVQGRIRASTSGGSVKAYISQQPTGDCRLTTSGGRVDVYLADGIGVDVDAHSSGGRASSDFTMDDARLSKNTLRGKINGGGPQLYLRSSGGGVSIQKN